MQFHGMTRIHRLYEDDDDDNCEEDVDWFAGDCDDELDETAYTAGTPTGDPQLLEEFDDNLEDVDASATQENASARRSFQEARELLARGKSARGYFLVVGIGAFDGLLIENLQSLVAKAKEGQEERKILVSERWKTDTPGYTWRFAQTTDFTF